MARETDMLTALLTGEQGQDLIEYALIAGVVSLVAITALKLYALNGVQTVFSAVGSTLSSAM